MKSVYCVDFLICSVLVIASVGFSKAELEQTKNRRGSGGTSGLFATSRVGRSDPSLNGNIIRNPDASIDNVLDALYPASVEEYDEFSFPKAGRSPDAGVRKWALFVALQKALNKFAGPSAIPGIWFGPRLGRENVDIKQFDKSLQQKNEY